MARYGCSEGHLTILTTKCILHSVSHAFKQRLHGDRMMISSEVQMRRYVSMNNTQLSLNFRLELVIIHKASSRFSFVAEKTNITLFHNIICASHSIRQ